MTWQHKDGVENHEVDPHYNGNGLPDYWTCHSLVAKGQTCDRELLIDGNKVPMTVPIKKSKNDSEPPLSSQP